MSSNTRFIKSVIEASTSNAPALPWERGSRRAAFIAARAGQMDLRKTA